MIVSTDVLQAILTNFRAIYEQTFAAAMQQTFYPRFAMEVPSTSLIESYNWFGSVPEPREWTDERQAGGLYPYNQSVKNLHYEDTVDVDRDYIEDDRLGMVRPRVQQLGMAYPIFVEKNLVQALVNGAVSGNNSYDGVTFYNASHVIGKAAAQTNLYAYTGATLATVQADFAGAKAQMRNFQDDQARQMSLSPDFVLCAPAQEQVFTQMLNASFIPAGSIAAPMANTFVGQADLGVSPYVTAATWHLLCTRMPIKPLIFQVRKQPEFVSLDRIDDYAAFHFKKYFYGIDFRCAFAYGEWFTAIKVA